MTTTQTDSHAVRLRLLQFGRRFAFPLPDALMALICAAAAYFESIPHEMREEVFFALIVEGGFLMAQATLVDIATRLKKRPPIWVVALIVIGVMVFSQYSLNVIQLAWQRGSLVFVPLLISIAERGTVLWRMPNRPQIEKIAARALVANRITTGLALCGLMVVGLIAGIDTTWLPLYAGALYFAIAAFDDWRVRGPKFAERPRVLFGYDAIGIKYLEPV